MGVLILLEVGVGVLELMGLFVIYGLYILHGCIVCGVGDGEVRGVKGGYRDACCSHV